MHYETLSYGDHALQTITIATPSPPTTPSPSTYWIVLIHGGAWRDPTQTATNYLTPATSHLPWEPEEQSRITGLASISYRLSPHPSHPQDPHKTPSQDLRLASHPDHIYDVRTALAYLQDRYALGDRYVLVGHSCGATLAFQSVMGCFTSDTGTGVRGAGRGEVTPPRAILGMAGIYDLKLLRDTHPDISAYQEFIEGAFGPDETRWDAVSPAVVRGSQGVEGGWRGGRLAVLAHSLQDGLVDLEQRDVMRESLQLWREEGAGERSVEVLDSSGEHDEAWETGVELARAITFTLERLSAVDGA